MPSAQGAGSTHLRYATPWQARWHVTVLSTFAKATADKPLRFSTGLASPEQSEGGRLESEATADHMAAAPCRHRAFKPPRCRRRRGERGNLKNVYCVPQAPI